MNRIAVITLAVMMASCAGTRELAEFQRDSVIVHVRDSVYLRDTVIMWQIPPESGANTLPDSDTSFLQTNLAESRAFIENGRLHHTLRNRSEAIIPIEVRMPVRIHHEEKGLTRYLKTVERVEVEKDLSRWQQFLQGLGWAVLVAGALWLAWKLSKIVRI